MRAPAKSYIVEIDDFLAKNNATLFGENLWRRLMIETLNRQDFLPTMILAPSDNALAELTRVSNRTWQEIVQSPEGKDILKNHISVRATLKHWPMFTAINHTNYGNGQADLDALQPGASIIIQVSNFVNIVIIIVGKVILHNDQLVKLRRSLVGHSVWQRADSTSLQVPSIKSILTGAEIPKLGKDVFRLLVTDQNLIGRDLLALCTSNSEIATMCDRDNQLLFRNLLIKEFNFDYNRGFAKESPRELYAKFHHYRLEVYVHSQEDVVNDPDVSSSYITVKNNRRPQTKIKPTGELVAIPVEGWFANNFDKHSIAGGFRGSSYTDRNLERLTVYLIYVKGRPETATLFHRKIPGSWGDGITIETSNDWFSKFFLNRPFSAQPLRLRNVPNSEALMAELLMAHFGNYAFLVQTFDADYVIVFTTLSGNELV